MNNSTGGMIKIHEPAIGMIKVWETVIKMVHTTDFEVKHSWVSNTTSRCIRFEGAYIFFSDSLLPLAKWIC